MYLNYPPKVIAWEVYKQTRTHRKINVLLLHRRSWRIFHNVTHAEISVLNYTSVVPFLFHCARLKRLRDSECEPLNPIPSSFTAQDLLKNRSFIQYVVLSCDKFIASSKASFLETAI